MTREVPANAWHAQTHVYAVTSNAPGAGEDIPADAPRFWRAAFRLRPRRGGAGGGVAAPALLAPAAPDLLAAGKAALLLRAARARLDARRARAAACMCLCTGACAMLPGLHSWLQHRSRAHESTPSCSAIRACAPAADVSTFLHSCMLTRAVMLIAVLVAPL
jgi:hypothetical protein